MEKPEFHHVFVVGCSRSGTTLLQSMLANHSQIYTFPETGVFLKALGMRGRVLPWARLGITLGKERKALARLLALQTIEADRLPNLPPRRLRLRRSVSDIVEFLDHLSAANGKKGWVEKTPRHVFHSRMIRQMVPGSLCIHLIRDGRDVVASIVDRARRFPDRFPRQGHPNYGIQQWNRSIRATAEALNDPGHAVLTYRGLALEPESRLRALCLRLGIEFEEGLLRPADPKGFTQREEVWKSAVSEPVVPAASKFTRVFDAGTRRRIEDRLDLELFEKLKARAEAESGGVLLSGTSRPGEC